MMENGWIKIYRCIWDWPYSTDSDHISVWLRMLTLATHRQTKMAFNGGIIDVMPGQFICSRRSLSTATGVSESKVERVIGHLKTEQQIEQQGGSTSRLITILSWDKYQKNEQQSEQESDSNRTASGQPSDTNKKKRSKEITDNVQDLFVKSEFDKFWIEYPKKKAKFEAEKAWRKVNQDLYDTVICAVKEQKINGCLNNEPKYIPLPASWLNGKRWTDEVVVGAAVEMPPSWRIK